MSNITSKYDSAIAKKGNEGEQSFKEWLDSIEISYVAICQAKETFAQLFRTSSDQIKRPDFFVLFESIGMIAVDVINYTQGDSRFRTLNYNEEVKKVLTFERLFRLPVWYAYYIDGTKWHWISALKAVEVGKLIEPKGNDPFLSIMTSEFIDVSTNDDLGKLFGARLPSLKNIGKM